MKNIPIVPLMALCALFLSLHPVQAGQDTPTSASYWDHIVGGPGASAATWYVPPAQMTAYEVSRDTSINTRIKFSNYYQFTCKNGVFQGPTVVSMEKLTPAGWIGRVAYGDANHAPRGSPELDKPALRFAMGQHDQVGSRAATPLA